MKMVWAVLWSSSLCPWKDNVGRVLAEESTPFSVFDQGVGITVESTRVPCGVDCFVFAIDL